MSEWTAKMEKRVKALEDRLARVAAQSDEYPARARLEDQKLADSIDHATRTWKSIPLNIFDDLGAATAAAADRAPKDADYLVKTANSTLTAERVVTDTSSVTWDFATAGQAKANVAFGSTASTACVGNDSRLSDARVPTSHASSHLIGGSDTIFAAQTGYGTSNHVDLRSFDEAAVTLTQLGHVVGTLLQDMNANKWPTT